MVHVGVRCASEKTVLPTRRLGLRVERYHTLDDERWGAIIGDDLRIIVL